MKVHSVGIIVRAILRPAQFCLRLSKPLLGPRCTVHIGRCPFRLHTPHLNTPLLSRLCLFGYSVPYRVYDSSGCTLGVAGGQPVFLLLFVCELCARLQARKRVRFARRLANVCARLANVCARLANVCAWHTCARLANLREPRMRAHSGIGKPHARLTRPPDPVYRLYAG